MPTVTSHGQTVSGHGQTAVARAVTVTAGVSAPGIMTVTMMLALRLTRRVVR